MESLNIITHKNNPYFRTYEAFLEEPKSPAVVFTCCKLQHCSVEVTHGFNECDEV